MIPVVFIHNGAQEYLKCAIESAKKLDNEIVLLGDETNKFLSDKWYDMDMLAGKRYESFKKDYVHMSTNSYEFELACFKRYFSLLSYMESEGISRCIMIDSDILTYCTYETLNCFQQYDFVATIPYGQAEFDWCVGPQILGITLEALKDLVCYIEDTYNNHLERLKAKDVYYKERHLKGGICDMSLLYLWVQRTEFSCYNLLDYKEAVFDNSVQMANYDQKIWFQRNVLLGIKKLILRNDKLYVVREDNNERVEVATLHFQGSAKSIMADVYYGRNKLVICIHRYVDYGKRILKKMRR